MPRPDPLPRPPAGDRARLKRALRLVAGFALAAAVLAVVLVSAGQSQFRLHMVIATGAGVALTVFLAGALMLLVFFSAASGHDEEVAGFDPEEDE